MTHLCTYHSTGGTKPSSCIKIIHWVILSIIIGATVIDWAFYTDQVVRFKDVWGTRGNSNDYYEMMFRGQVMECVTQIIRWVASAEILAWNIFVVTKSMRFYPKLRVGVCGCLPNLSLTISFTRFRVSSFCLEVCFSLH